MAPRKPKSLDRVAELRKLHDVLADKLETAEGSGAAALALQMRQISRELEDSAHLETDYVDELAKRRKPEAGPARPPSSRRKSGSGTRGD